MFSNIKEAYKIWKDFKNNGNQIICDCCPHRFENNVVITGYTTNGNGDLVSITVSENGNTIVLNKK